MQSRLGLRPLWLATIFAAAFILWTTSPNEWRHKFPPLGQGEPFWTEAKSAGLTREEESNISIYERSSRATVSITSTVLQQGWFFDVYPVEGSGSGFVIDADGHILTNHHVIAGNSPQVEVTLNDRSRFHAEILATDEANDLALLRIKADKKLDYLTLSTSENLKVGQKVLAIGNPFGLDGTLTTGVISSIGRSIRDRNSILEDLIQTDAAINPGNSGGPLLDSSGNVIGVNTAIYGPGGNIGIGFAMPINRAKPLLEYVRSGGKSRQALELGVRSIFISGRIAQALELPAESGYLIESVDPGSAADEAGLRGATRQVAVGNYLIPWGGDFIIAVDGREVINRRVLSQALSLKRGGDTLTLTVIRGEQRMDVKVILKSAAAKL
jgi:S1-C subfamily serine protease